MTTVPSDHRDARERALLDRARRGDESAFGQLVEPHRGLLDAHCYRMLGSVHDAEDALQDAMLRAWRSLPAFQGRSSLRSWLYRIATNTCLDLINRRPKRVLPLDYGPPADPHDGPGRPLAESVWIEPYPDAHLQDGPVAPDARYEQRESVELAFIAALQHLPASQRAVLILREVLGFSAREVADTLDTTVASVNSALQRARKAVEDKLPEQSQQATLRTLGDDRLTAIVDTYMAAWERGDVETVVGLLAEDVTMAMPPMAAWWRGRDKAEVFLRRWAFAKAWAQAEEAFVAAERTVRVVRTRLSGQVALGAYRIDPATGVGRPYAVQLLTFDGDRIADVTAFVMPGLFGRLGLPEELRDVA